MKTSEKSHLKIGLLGASFDTGNMGVSALAESSIKIVLHSCPNAEVTLLGSGYVPQEYRLPLYQKQVCVKTVPIRFSKNIFLPYHFMWFTLDALLTKILPGSSLKKALVRRNPYFQTLYEMDFVVDITGGDSFSDIYGMRRFILGFLHKWLMIFLGKKLIFLPQTYGPFKKTLARVMAKYILKRASVVYSRDINSLEYVKNLLKNNEDNEKFKCAPDVAFILDPREPEHLDVGPLLTRRNKNSIVIGVNISGLLYNGGYTKNNMFKLKTNYAQLVPEVIKSLLEDQRTLILLVPHVFPPEGYEVESDPHACMKVYEQFNKQYPGRIFLAGGHYNHNEIKFIIGLCDFFIGSRMHSCIAALSQMIPSVGLAYSKKFSGVFHSIDISDLAIDLRHETEETILTFIRKAFSERKAIATKLNERIPEVQRIILNTINPIL